MSSRLLKLTSVRPSTSSDRPTAKCKLNITLTYRDYQSVFSIIVYTENPEISRSYERYTAHCFQDYDTAKLLYCLPVWSGFCLASTVCASCLFYYEASDSSTAVQAHRLSPIVNELFHLPASRFSFASWPMSSIYQRSLVTEKRVRT